MADYDGITQGAGNQGPVTPGVPHTIERPTQPQPWGSNNYEVDNINQRGGTRTSPSLGDLGRNYNFGNTYTNLSFARDPFVHLLTKFKKKPADDFKFEYAVKRNLASFKRYGYVIATDPDASALSSSSLTGTGADADNLTDGESVNKEWGDAALAEMLASFSAFNGTTVPTDASSSPTFSVLMAGDYKIHGNITNKIGNTANNSKLGAYLTKPTWFLKNQVIRIPVTDSSNLGSTKGYVLARILDVQGWEWKTNTTISNTVTEGVVAHGVELLLKMVKDSGDTSVKYPSSITNTTVTSQTLLNVDPGATEVDSIAQRLEPMRCYISGSAYHELSGYGDTWRQQPFSTDYGQTQIFKKTAMMSGRAMATKLKFGQNPWKEEWQDKMTEMTWEIGQAGYFGEQFTDDDGITYTEGIVNFILNNGNSFTWSAQHTVDDYMEQMSALNDPRFQVGGKQSNVYFCNTQVWNWHAKLGGFMKNNAEISANYNVQFSGTGKMAGVKYRSFDVDGTTIKLVRDIHLDQTHVKMIAANMSACAIRPLVGNGVNRDVTVYPGVKTVSNSGEDYRVDLIQGDIGFEFGAPETHAVWL